MATFIEPLVCSIALCLCYIVQMCQSLPTALHLSLHLGFNQQYKLLHLILKTLITEP